MSEFINANFNGLDKLSKMLKEYEVTEEDTIHALEAGAQELIDDVRKLPQPRSQIKAAGYTHLLDTVTYKRNRKEIEVGWGKVYGPAVEYGTRKRRSRPHIRPTFKSNQKKYYETIEKKLFG